ncbi:MAG: glycosyltransferase family 4 protein [Caldilineales bacterium]|nr:glycosyltransferase family 4 protein [Caldilineales bacterium]
MPKIRVAHIITRFHGAGGAKNTLFTCAGLDKERYEVDLIVGTSADSWRAEEAGVHWVQLDDMLRSIHPLYDFRAGRALLQLCRERDYHIVHTHLAKAGILGRWAAHRAGTPIIIHTLHGATFSPVQNRLSNGLYLMLERRTAPWTDRFISVGEDLRQRYLAAGIGSPDRYSVIHSGMDLRAFRLAGEQKAVRSQAIRQGLGLAPDDFVTGYVAALEWRKGHHHLVKMLQPLCQQYPQLQVLFVGEGYDHERISAVVQEAGLTSRIHFTGYRTDVADVMAALDAKLFASEREGLPQVLVQAAAVGLPVLAFEAEGVRELVHEGVNGHVFAYGDAAGMRAALKQWIDDPALAVKMGGQGPALVDERWTVETMQAKTNALYADLLAEKGL